MRKMKKVLCLAVGILFFINISSTLSYAGTGLRIGYNMPPTNLPFTIAKELKIFEKYGLKVDGLEKTPIDDVLAAKAVDGVVAANTDGIIRMNQRGSEVVIVATLIHQHTMAVVVRNDFDESRMSEEFDGAAVGVLTLGVGSAWNAYTKMMKILKEQHGVKSLSIGPVRMPYGTMLASLAAGRIKAAIINTQYLRQAQRLGLKKLFDFSEDPYPFHIIAFHKEFIDNNPRLVERFIQAIAEAIYVMKSDKAVVMRLLETKYKISNTEDREYVYDYLLQVVAPLFDIRPKNIEIAVGEGSKVDVSRMVDVSFVDRLENSGFFDKFRAINKTP